MDREGFIQLLKTRNLSNEKISASIEIAERFERYLEGVGAEPDKKAVWNFCTMLIEQGENTYDNLLTLARYGRFIKDNNIYVAVLELLDGAEVQPNLYKKVGERFGEKVRDEVFAGIGVSALGVSPPEKPYDLFPVIDRLVGRVGEEAVEELLSGCLRDLPDEYYAEDREKFSRLNDIDRFLVERHQELVNRLRKCQEEGELFFSQEITDEVVRYVEEHPETECGVRMGHTLYITKIPYDARHYLGETDPVMKRYYACHCPWAREAIRNENILLNPIFCNCSGGYSKKPWEIIFGQTLKVEVLESALKGDFRCRFAVHLPE